MQNRQTDTWHIIGPAALAIFATIYNLIATHNRKPTISTGVRHISGTRWGAILAGSVIGGLIAHWFIDEGN